MNEKETITGWAARDEGGGLYFYYGGGEPVRAEGDRFFMCRRGEVMHLPTTAFPSVTPENSPVKMEMTIEITGNDDGA